MNQSNETKSLESTSSPRLSSNSVNLLNQQQQQQQTMTTAVPGYTSPIKTDDSLKMDLKQQELAQTTTTTTSSNGVVRRLSVTARPGDIFYKVKDVTESSTSDTLNNYDSSTNNVANDVNDYAEIDNLNDDEEKEIIIKPISKNEDTIITNSTTVDNQLVNETTTTSVASFNQSNSTLSRKTTTWNVKRTQTTSLGVSPVSNESHQQFKPKDDISVVKQTNNVEPGSPLFSKELLSIK